MFERVHRRSWFEIEEILDLHHMTVNCRGFWTMNSSQMHYIFIKYILFYSHTNFRFLKLHRIWSVTDPRSEIVTTNLVINIYIYIYIYMCVCVCVCVRAHVCVCNRAIQYRRWILFTELKIGSTVYCFTFFYGSRKCRFLPCSRRLSVRPNLLAAAHDTFSL